MAGKLQQTPPRLRQDSQEALFFEDIRNRAALLDVVQTWTAAQRGKVTALTDAASITIDLNASNNFSVTLGGNRTLANPTNTPVAGQSGVITVTQDSGAPRTLAYGNQYKSAAGAAITLSTGNGDIDDLYYYVKSATEIHLAIALDWQAIP